MFPQLTSTCLGKEIKFLSGNQAKQNHLIETLPSNETSNKFTNKDSKSHNKVSNQNKIRLGYGSCNYYIKLKISYLLLFPQLNSTCSDKEKKCLADFRAKQNHLS
jgi:hypothetical protein